VQVPAHDSLDLLRLLDLQQIPAISVWYDGARPAYQKAAPPDEFRMPAPVA
jgi:hypothetical protein